MLIRSVAESDSERVKRLVENEVMGDRKPSQFYQDLKKLARPFASEQFILTLWKNRLPDRIRRVLAVFDDTNPEKIIQAADRVQEACSVRHESGTAAVSKTEVQDTEAPGSTGNIEKRLILAFVGEHVRDLREDVVVGRDPETASVIIMIYTESGRENADPRVAGIRETGPAVRKRGER
jgi:hypothetical protein